LRGINNKLNKKTMTKSEEINQILHQHIRLVFKDAINYKELIQALLDWNEKQLTIHDVIVTLVCEHCESKSVTVGDGGLWCDDCGKLTKKAN
jgi:hypothetical protein